VGASSTALASLALARRYHLDQFKNPIDWYKLGRRVLLYSSQPASSIPVGFLWLRSIQMAWVPYCRLCGTNFAFFCLA